MTPDLPSLVVYPGLDCPRCHAELQLVGMCGLCGWDSSKEQVRKDMADVSRRVRVWRFGRGVQS